MRVSLKYAVTSHYSGLSGVKVAAFGIHQFKTDQTIRKLSLRTVSVWHRDAKVHGCHNFRYVWFFGQPKRAFIYDSGAKLNALGTHWLKADPTVQEVSPRTVPVRHQRYNKKPAKPAFNQRPCRHSIHYE